MDDPVSLGELPQSLTTGQIVSFRNVKASIPNIITNRCIGVDGASTANGALLKIFDCDNAPNQRWRAEVRNGIEHTLVNVKSGKCMGVDGASTSPGANIGQFDCGNAAPNQTWLLVSQTNDQEWNLLNAKSGLCIGVDGGSTANGAQLKQFGCQDTAPNQEWVVIFR